MNKKSLKKKQRQSLHMQVMLLVPLSLNYRKIEENRTRDLI